MHQKRDWLSWCTLFFLCALVFLIPIEHKYDKPFRFFSQRLIPENFPKGYDYKIFFYVSDLIALVLIGIALWRGRAKTFFLGRGSVWLWTLFSLATLSVITSVFSLYLLPYTRLLQLLTPVALFSFLAYGLTEDEKKIVQRAALSILVIAALFQSCVAIAQYFQQESLGLRLIGEQRLHPSLGHCAAFHMRHGERWLFDAIFPYVGAHNNVLRAYGTLPHANVLGGFLFCSIVATYALWASTNRKFRWLWAATIPLQLFALCLSYSRSALYALAIASILWFFLMRKEKVRSLFFWVIGSTLLSFGLLFNQYTERGNVVTFEKKLKIGDQGRLLYQSVALRMIQAHPLTGVGYNQFSLHSPSFFPPDKDPAKFPSGAHNIYLFLATEMGLPALLAFLFFIGVVLRSYWLVPRNSQTTSLIALFIGLLFIGFCDLYPIFFQQGKLLFFLGAGLLVANVQPLPPRNLENVQRPIADV